MTALRLFEDCSKHFSVSLRPLGFGFVTKGFGAKGLGPGLDNFFRISGALQYLQNREISSVSLSLLVIKCHKQMHWAFLGSQQELRVYQFLAVCRQLEVGAKEHNDNILLTMKYGWQTVKYLSTVMAIVR